MGGLKKLCKETQQENRASNLVSILMHENNARRGARRIGAQRGPDGGQTGQGVEVLPQCCLDCLDAQKPRKELEQRLPRLTEGYTPEKNETAERRK